MRRVGVQRVEVVGGRLDLGSLGDAEAEAEEDVLEVASGLGEQVQMPTRERRRAGQRDVDAIIDEPRIQLGTRELRRARLDELAPPPARGGGRPGRAAGGALPGGGSSSATPRGGGGSSALRPR